MRKKHILIVLDGAADLYRNDDRLSPLALAEIPFMDKIAALGINGRMQTLFTSLPRESLVAHLGMLGWDPLKCYPGGRASAEFLGNKEMSLDEDEICFRANFVLLDNDRLISYNANYIDTETASLLVDEINSRLMNGFPEIKLYANSDFRNTLVISGSKASPGDIHCLEPHENVNRRIDAGKLVTGRTRESSLLADRMNSYLSRVSDILHSKPANAIIPWSASSAFRLTPFDLNTGFTGKSAIVGAMDFLRGIAVAGGMEFFKVGNGQPRTNFHGKGQKVLKLLQQGYEFIVCHINAPDEASHMQSLDLKIETLENIDKYIVGPVYEYFVENSCELGGLMIIPDHYTNVWSSRKNGRRINAHSMDPVPFALWNNQDTDSVDRFCEDSALEGRYGGEALPSSSLIKLLIPSNVLI